MTNTKPFLSLEDVDASVVRGAQVQRHDDREAVQQQVVDDTDDGADEDLAVGDEDGSAFGQFLELFLTAQALALDDLVLRYEEEAHERADDGERQSEPEGLVFADDRHDEARQISAEHADAQREAGPEEAGCRSESRWRNVLSHQHDEAVDEQRVADATHGVQAQNQRIDMAWDGDAEEQQMYADPPACTEHHDLTCAEHFGKHTCRPSAEGSEQAVHGDQQRGLGRGESLIHHEFRQKCQFETITGHEDGNGEEAKHQRARNAKSFKNLNHASTLTRHISQL